LNLNNLIINNPSGVSFNAAAFYFIAGTLDLQNGTLNNGANTITLDSNATATRTNGYVRGRITKRFFSANLPAFTFPLGTANGYSPVTVEITSGTTEVTASVFETNQPNLNPAASLHRYWTLTNNNGNSFTANLTFNYLESDVFGNEANYRITRVSGAVPTSFANNCAGGSPCVETAGNTAVINGVTQFSDWTLSEIAPTAANVSLGGRILTKEGGGIARIPVTLTDSNGVSRSVLTNTFGYFRFTEVAAGETYLVGVAGKKFVFEPNTQIINAATDLSDINFIGTEF